MYFNDQLPITMMGWLIICSAAVVAIVSVIGIVNEQYKDTFIQCVGLCMMCGMSLIVILQYFTLGMPTTNAFGGVLLGIAIYGIGTILKHMRYERRARNQRRRRNDA